MDRQITYAEAIREATEQAMEADPLVIVMGLAVDDPKPIYGTTRGLAERFGPERVFNTPLSEDAMTGVAIGAALAGLRPIHVHIRMDFLMLCMNQLVNMAAKMRAMSGGAVSVPLVVRAIIGKSWGQGAQHSQGLYSMLMHVPGLKVVAPSTPYDAKGILVQALRDPNPVLMVEHRLLHDMAGYVPEPIYNLPFGYARFLAEGSDVTLVGISYMAQEAFRASRMLASAGIRAEVIDPVTLNPLDLYAIEGSVRKTGRLIVIDCDWTQCGAGAEIVAALHERGVPMQAKRMGFAPTVCPTTRPLENLFYPNPATIAQAAVELVTGEQSWVPSPVESAVTFKGPF